MYVILVYDIELKRIDAVRITVKQYLNWVQNSVFEGDITEFRLAELESKITKLIDTSRDSVLVFSTNNPKWIRKKVLGIDKNDVGNIL